MSSFPLRSDVDYLSKRYRGTHDLVHALTGYGIDDHREMELQAFVWGNLGLRQNPFLLLAGVFRLLPQLGPWGLRHDVADLRAAYDRGCRSEDLLAVPFEAMWDEPLEDVRDRLVATAGERRPSPLADVA